MATVIEVNGKRYNALTGALVGGPKSLDGFVVSTPMQTAPVAAMTQVQHLDAPRIGQQHAQRHPVQHSKTLMRQSVQHPIDGFKRHAKTTTNTGAIVKAPQFDITPKHSAQVVDRTRLERAGQVMRSNYVQRFAPGPITQRAAPDFAPRVSSTPQPPISLVGKPLATSKLRGSSDIFEQALATANSHKEPYVPAKHHAKRGHRVRIAASITSAVMAVALIVGFVAYQNASLIQLRIASSHAGMNATLPIWQPSGFHLGTFAYSPGNVAITYNDAASDQSYTISQSPTKWDAATLLSTYVNPNNQTYNSLNSGNTTIYTYGANNATWVSGGIWYKLVSSGSLSNSQIVNIATSMRS